MIKNKGKESTEQDRSNADNCLSWVKTILKPCLLFLCICEFHNKNRVIPHEEIPIPTPK